MHADKPKDQSLAIAYSTQRSARKKGMPMQSAPGDHEEHYDSIADAILRKKKNMADGGMVESDNEETPADPSPFDMDNADLKELYDEPFSEEPVDSNEKGDEREDDEENKLDMVDAIRKRIKKQAP